MENHNIKEKHSAKLPTREELIFTEQEVVNELRRMMQDASLTLKERLRAAAVLALHMNTLNRMITENGEKGGFEELNLGDLVRTVEPRIVYLRREPAIWKRTHTYRRH